MSFKFVTTMNDSKKQYKHLRMRGGRPHSEVLSFISFIIFIIISIYYSFKGGGGQILPLIFVGFS